MTVRRLDHVYYWTADMDAAVDFYRDVIGLPLLRRDGDSWAEFDAGRVRFAVHGRAPDQPVPAGGTVVFEVADLDATRRELEGRGARFEEAGEVEGYARFASLRDPDDNLLQIIEYRGPGEAP